MAQWLTNPTSIHEDVGQSLSLLRGLRIWRCSELWCGLQTWLLKPVKKDHRPSFFFFSFSCFFRAAPTAYEGSQAKGQIGATDAGLQHSHSNTGSKPHLGPTPQLMATPDP